MAGQLWCFESLYKGRLSALRGEPNGQRDAAGYVGAAGERFQRKRFQQSLRSQKSDELRLEQQFRFARSGRRFAFFCPVDGNFIL